MFRRKHQPETSDVSILGLVLLSHISLTQLLNALTLKNKIFERMTDSKEFFNQHATGSETSHKDELQYQELWEDLPE